MRKSSEKAQKGCKRLLKTVSRLSNGHCQRTNSGVDLTKHQKRLEQHPVTSEPWKLTGQKRAFQSDLVTHSSNVWALSAALSGGKEACIFYPFISYSVCKVNAAFQLGWRRYLSRYVKSQNENPSITYL